MHFSRSRSNSAWSVTYGEMHREKHSHRADDEWSNLSRIAVVHKPPPSRRYHHRRNRRHPSNFCVNQCFLQVQMARTKASFTSLWSIHSDCWLSYFAIQQTARKSTGGEPLNALLPLEIFLEFWLISSCFTGKAPRKQLATKAARKTATVRVPTYYDPLSLSAGLRLH